MSIRNKLLLIAGVMLLALASLGFQGHRVTSDIRLFAEKDLHNAIEGSNAVMDARITSLRMVWSALLSASTTDEKLLSAAKALLEEGLKEYPGSIAELKSSGLVNANRVEEISKMLANLSRDATAIARSVPLRKNAMEALDKSVRTLVEAGLDKDLGALPVHALWSLSMGANDYAAYGDPEAKKEYLEWRGRAAKLELPAGTAAQRDETLRLADELMRVSETIFVARKTFDEQAALLDHTMELLEKGQAGEKGADEQVVELMQRMENKAADAFIAFLVTVLIGAAISLTLCLLILRSITAPLVRVQRFASEVGGGNLDAQIPGSYVGELATLKNALEIMVSTLKGKLLEVEQAVREAKIQTEQAQKATREAEQAKREAEQAERRGRLEAASRLGEVVERTSTAATQLSSQAVEINRGAEAQRDRVANTATAMEEMSAAVLEVARNSSEAAANTDANREKATEGKQVVAQTIESIMEVQGSTGELSMVMSELSVKADSIGQVMTVISDIADQTNLLALNAAIEAARAGDAGRGFAVVADEVRKLAEKTMHATAEVGDAIRGIQDSVHNTSAKREDAERSLDKTIDLAQRAGSLLGEIVENVDASAGLVRSIATAAEEQSKTVEEINHGVEEINQIAGETAQGMRRSTESIEDLARQAQELQSLIRRMQG